ncbi:MAG: hypothetical protein A4E32_00876 [Methanomassiliicoccales archaeon PtaU1.Bin124]|nr:MAG: hypothetical protein A4E32_00876 [Methanomassiliicoccales archaeon PtaU1.Bin124]
MEENSKELAHAGSHGTLLHLEHLPIKSAKLRSAMKKFIVAWAKDLEDRGAVIGHVKMIAETDVGVLKYSVVDTGLGAEVVDELRGDTVKKGTVKVMAAVLNLDDEEVEASLDKELEPLDEQIGVHRAGHHCECEHEH